MPIAWNRNVSCIFWYSPLRVSFAPSIGFGSFASGSNGLQPPSGRGSPYFATTRFTSAATCPRSRPWTPIVRSIVGWRLVWTTSDGTDAFRTVATFRSGIDRFCSGLLIGMLSRVSRSLMSPSGYWTPTKYWLWLFGSIQKFLLLNWTLLLKAATMFRITSVWLNCSDDAFDWSTSITYCG